MMMSMGTDSNIVITSLTKMTNGMQLEIGYPETFTNRIDVYSATDVMERDWQMISDPLETTGTTSIIWVDTQYADGASVAFYAAGNHDLDSDGDGFSDAFEFFVLGTDPHDPDSYGVFLSGDVFYDGPESGSIYVQAVTESAEAWSKTWQSALSAPGPYTNLVANQQSYWVKSYMDVNGNQKHDIWEPWGLYSTNSLYATNDMTDLDITLEDQPSIWGTLAYSGGATGNIHVLATAITNWNTTYSTVIPWVQGDSSMTGDITYVSFPVDYAITGLPPGDYIIRAFIDENDDGQFTHLEPGGQYDVDPISVSNRVIGIDFTIDLDTNENGIPDWWEMEHFGSATGADAEVDDDMDGLTNLEEYLHGTDPNNSDTDGDGLSDWDEVNVYGTDPTNPDTDGDGMPDGWEVTHGFNPNYSGDALQPLHSSGLTVLNAYQLGLDPSSPLHVETLSQGDVLMEFKSREATRSKFTGYPAFVQPTNAPPVYYLDLDVVRFWRGTSMMIDHEVNYWEGDMEVIEESETYTVNSEDMTSTWNTHWLYTHYYSPDMNWEVYCDHAEHWEWTNNAGMKTVVTDGCWFGGPGEDSFSCVYNAGAYDVNSLLQTYSLSNPVLSQTQFQYNYSNSTSELDSAGLEWVQAVERTVEMVASVPYTTSLLNTNVAKDLILLDEEHAWNTISWGKNRVQTWSGSTCSGAISTEQNLSNGQSKRALDTNEVTLTLSETAYRFVVPTVDGQIYALIWNENFSASGSGTNQALDTRIVYFTGDGTTQYIGNPDHVSSGQSAYNTNTTMVGQGHDYVLTPPPAPLGNGNIGLLLPTPAEETTNADLDNSETVDPINIQNGNMRVSDRDLSIVAPGLPLLFERQYHSRSLTPISALGSGWRHTYDQRLDLKTNTLYKGQAGDWMKLSSLDGQSHWFRITPSGYVAPESGLRLEQAGENFLVYYPGALSQLFNANGVLTEISDDFGNHVSLSYTGTWPSQTLHRVEHSNGLYLEFTHQNGRMTRIDTPDSEWAVTYAYNSNGYLTNATRHVSGREEAFTYHYTGNGLMTSRKNAEGHVFSFGYESSSNGHRAVSMALNGSYYAHTVGYANTNVNQSDVTYDRNGTDQTFRYIYDPHNEVVREILGPNATNRGVRLTRDGRHNVLVRKQFDDDLDEYIALLRTYDSRNNVLSETLGYNTQSGLPQNTYTWHSVYDLPTSVTDPDGLSVNMSYQNGRIISSTLNAPGETALVTTFGYTTNGLLAAVTNALGHATHLTYDAHGHPASVIPPAGPVVEMEHNIHGHLEKVIMPYGVTNRVTTFTSDAAGRVTDALHPDSRTESFSYDLMGQLTNHVDVAGRTNSFEYLPAGRLAKTTRYLANGTPVSIQTDYDNQFNLLRVIDPLGRNVETYTLDIQDRVTSVTNLMGQVMTVDYGVADIVHSVTRFDGTVINNTYDQQARLIAQTLPGLTNAFTYTPGGRLTSITGGGVTLSNTYDGFYRVVAQEQTGAGHVHTVNYTWTPLGLIEDISTDADTWTHSYDPAGRITNLVSEVGSFAWTYNADNVVASDVTHTDSGIGAAYSFDITDRLTNLSWTATTPAFGFAMDYNAADMITNVVYASGERRVYVYDGIDRLVSEQHYDNTNALIHSAAFTYDLAGNRTQSVVNGITNTYALGIGDQLANWGESAENEIHYDAAGSVTNMVRSSSSDLALQWDSLYRLTAIATNGATAETYGYDPLGRRIRTTRNGVNTWHVYDSLHVLADVDDSGTVLRTYTWGTGIDNLLAFTDYTGTETNSYFAITDHLGTVHALADENGDIVESYRYDAWGNVLEVLDSNGNPITESALGNRYLFQGREYSWATGLYYFRARWYDPETGRFVSTDPIGISGGLNQYMAFNNNPMMVRDPLGLWGWGRLGSWWCFWVY